MTADLYQPARVTELPNGINTLLGALRRCTIRRMRGGKAQVAGVEALTFVAHELRTPLTVLRGYLSMIEDGTYPVPSETLDGAISAIAAKVREMDGLVEMLSVASRVAGGRLVVQRTRFDLAGAVQAAVAEVGDRARLEWALIDTRLPSYPVEVFADREHVIRILVNLLNNALTYSARPARVTVAFRRRESADVFVTDRGIGIAADRQRAIFERFVRLDDPRLRSAVGLGLGLPLSRELAELNGGSLSLVHSAPGLGSVFVLRVPLAKP
jgi:signal transduction histidine kinase